MHNLVLVEVVDGLAHILKVSPYLWFGDELVPEFVEKGASVGILQNHISGFLLLVDEVAQQLNDIGVV